MSLSAGQIINNRYRIVGLLGQGGFGAVYRAYDDNLGIVVAIKENFNPSPGSARQFALEARILAGLRHPNLPKVTDHFTLPDQGQYLVIEYIDGQDLTERLINARGRLPQYLVLGWAAQILDALTYLHSQKPPIIHRDIKPDNIRITPSGQAVLVDFGIAKLFTGGSQTTAAAKAITPGYSPVENYASGQTDERSDIYALGATLYTALTGIVPPESVNRFIGGQLAPIRQVNPSVTAQMEAAVYKAMEGRPENRFRSAGEFLAALPPRPIPGAPPGPPSTSVLRTGALPQPPSAYVTGQTPSNPPAAQNPSQYRPGPAPSNPPAAQNPSQVRPGRTPSNPPQGAGPAYPAPGQSRYYPAPGQTPSNPAPGQPSYPAAGPYAANTHWGEAGGYPASPNLSQPPGAGAYSTQYPYPAPAGPQGYPTGYPPSAAGAYGGTQDEDERRRKRGLWLMLSALGGLGAIALLVVALFVVWYLGQTAAEPTDSIFESGQTVEAAALTITAAAQTEAAANFTPTLFAPTETALGQPGALPIVLPTETPLATATPASALGPAATQIPVLASAAPDIPPTAVPTQPPTATFPPPPTATPIPAPTRTPRPRPTSTPVTLPTVAPPPTFVPTPTAALIFPPTAPPTP